VLRKRAPPRAEKMSRQTSAISRLRSLIVMCEPMTQLKSSPEEKAN
jgi:hypothetical protein